MQNFLQDRRVPVSTAWLRVTVLPPAAAGACKCRQLLGPLPAVGLQSSPLFRLSDPGTAEPAGAWELVPRWSCFSRSPDPNYTPSGEHQTQVGASLQWRVRVGLRPHWQVLLQASSSSPVVSALTTEQPNTEAELNAEAAGFSSHQGGRET